MSIVNKKNALAVALVAGLGLAASAAAYTLQVGPTAGPVFVATADVVNATTDIGVNEVFTISLGSNDNILGRTTGFTIRYDLNNGAKFAEILDVADLSTGTGAPGWVPTVAAGGGVGTGFLVINMAPPASGAPLTVGPVLNIAASTGIAPPTAATGQILENLTVLQTEGGVVQAAVQFIDPVTATPIMASQSVTILTSGDPVILDCDATDGEATKRIDVGTTDTQAPKTFFSPLGDIGSINQEGFINLGSISAAVAPDFATSFTYLATDVFSTVVSGNFAAFDQLGGSVFLATDDTCAASLVTGDIDTATNTVTFDYTGADLGANFTPTGFPAVFVCAEVPAGNDVVIDATPVSVATTFTRGAVDSNGASCPLQPLAYNGSVVEVYHLNPAGNTTAQSFMRVINPGNTAGQVTIDGIDDQGVAGDTSITFTLGARKSMQLNSEDLENGNAAKGLTGAFGNGAGKWRATVTGEFAEMKVQSLNRNATDGTVTNLTDADSQAEQDLNGLLGPIPF